ncbi:hypothetical protein MBM_10007 [Drepanopeziza brunnea f. sp. 'multigermtubi' MB_m1]|uniref:Uncharacterized protein n=1 Tax=Marssonina brunnea f. sp. multigermtubi (strain MB_m1) TaxID=1072389 RepID=K1WTB2_MARBU|nr:uncharacterized protein MBM_10007 [Drepanopeziza brunnea f. sp. 'multigermtubi' MB_m1]EKD11838.1 hypothetical protein MBM_10007 [Drepanopeziza brunnea f. sp. 'multigermtubi' MB_m1]
MYRLGKHNNFDHPIRAPPLSSLSVDHGPPRARKQSQQTESKGYIRTVQGDRDRLQRICESLERLGMSRLLGKGEDRRLIRHEGDAIAYADAGPGTCQAKTDVGAQVQVLLQYAGDGGIGTGNGRRGDRGRGSGKEDEDEEEEEEEVGRRVVSNSNSNNNNDNNSNNKSDNHDHNNSGHTKHKNKNKNNNTNTNPNPRMVNRAFFTFACANCLPTKSQWSVLPTPSRRSNQIISLQPATAISALFFIGPLQFDYHRRLPKPNRYSTFLHARVEKYGTGTTQPTHQLMDGRTALTDLFLPRDAVLAADFTLHTPHTTHHAVQAHAHAAVVTPPWDRTSLSSKAYLCDTAAAALGVQARAFQQLWAGLETNDRWRRRKKRLAGWFKGWSSTPTNRVPNLPRRFLLRIGPSQPPTYLRYYIPCLPYGKYGRCSIAMTVIEKGMDRYLVIIMNRDNRSSSRESKHFRGNQSGAMEGGNVCEQALRITRVSRSRIMAAPAKVAPEGPTASNRPTAGYRVSLAARFGVANQGHIGGLSRRIVRRTEPYQSCVFLPSELWPTPIDHNRRTRLRQAIPFFLEARQAMLLSSHVPTSRGVPNEDYWESGNVTPDTKLPVPADRSIPKLGLPLPLGGFTRQDAWHLSDSVLGGLQRKHQHSAGMEGRATTDSHELDPLDHLNTVPFGTVLTDPTIPPFFITGSAPTVPHRTKHAVHLPLPNRPYQILPQRVHHHTRPAPHRGPPTVVTTLAAPTTFPSKHPVYREAARPAPAHTHQHRLCPSSQPPGPAPLSSHACAGPEPPSCALKKSRKFQFMIRRSSQRMRV